MAFKPGNKAAAGADHTKRKVLTQHLIAELNETDAEGVTRLRKIVKALVENAEDHDNVAIEHIFSRIEGKPAQAITGPDGEKLIEAINITFVNP